MTEAKKLAERGGPEGTVVIAERQAAGKGRFDRSWVSVPGKDLTFSVVLRPAPAQVPHVNMAAALSVCSTVGEMTGLHTTIKWPNDVKLMGRKVSGILVESMVTRLGVDYTVLGVGLNVNSDPASTPAISSIATSVCRETGKTFDRTDVLVRVLRELDNRYSLIRAGFSMRDEWISYLETLGRNVLVRWRNHIEEGRAAGVDDHGNLILTTADGAMKTVIAGEVTLRP